MNFYTSNKRNNLSRSRIREGREGFLILWQLNKIKFYLLNFTFKTPEPYVITYILTPKQSSEVILVTRTFRTDRRTNYWHCRIFLKENGLKRFLSDRHTLDSCQYGGQANSLLETKWRSLHSQSTPIRLEKGSNPNYFTD